MTRRGGAPTRIALLGSIALGSIALGGIALGGIALGGCNSLLGNANFTGPDAGVDCKSRGLPPTTLHGTVFAPNQTLPIYNALVYVPTAALADIPDGASGPTCASGMPKVTAFSDSHGDFALEDVPAGSDISLVIQVGKWRRAVTVPAVAECTDTAVDASLTRLPRDSGEGHIPHIAISTGLSDSLECIARDLGIADTEITSGSDSTGRVRFYAGNGTNAFAAGGSFEPLAALTEGTAIRSYDQVMIGCAGNPPTVTPVQAQAMFDFANLGGWLWLTHYSYVYLQQGPAPWTTIGTFTATNTLLDGSTIVFDETTPRGQAFADWAVAAGASTMAGSLTLQYGRSSCLSADPAITQHLLQLDPAATPGVQMFSWDAAMSGRMVFSDLHLNPAQKPNPATTYPTECTTTATALSAQEKAIMFELFDTPTCLP